MTKLVGKLNSRSRNRPMAVISAAALAIAVMASPSTAHDGFVDLVEQLIPSVVSVNVEAEGVSSPFAGTPRQFLERYFQNRPEGEQQLPTTRVFGSGFFISEDGYIVTNAHVVENAVNIEVEFHDDRTFAAELVGADKNTDVAVLKIDAGDEILPALAFADSDKLRVGEHVLAIGNPYGLESSVSAGIVSGRERTTNGPYDDYIQTDAAINSGNSGGPLLNTAGEVVGVNTKYIASQRSSGFSGIGFAMASSVVENVAGQLIEYGTTRRGWLGVGLQSLSPELAEAQGLDGENGIIVNRLLDGPAADAGVMVGDVITALNGEEISDTRSMLRLVADAGSDTEVELTLYRRGDRQTVSVVLGSRERDYEAEEVRPASLIEQVNEGDALGLEVGELSAAQREALEMEEGASGLVVLGIDIKSPAFRQGIRKGDLITKVNHEPVRTIRELNAQIAAAEESGRELLLLFVESQGVGRFVAVPLPS